MNSHQESNRVDKHNYYLDIAEVVSERSTCLSKHYGCVLVKNDEIISTGYNGAPRGRKNCCDLGYCIRDKHGVSRGGNYNLCRSSHSEHNAIISASREKMIGSTLYLCGIDMKSKDANHQNYVVDANPCTICKRLIINSGISKVIIRDTKTQYRIIDVEEYINNDDTLSDDILTY